MKRLPGLDLLRAIAIVWVMLFHSWIVGGLGGPFQPVADYGWMGVDLFFVLSGYLIGFQLLEPLSRGEPLRFGRFYLRRAFRILPVFLVVLAIYTWLPSWREAPGMQPVWQFLTFTVNLLIDYPRNQAFSHAWSLCVEEHFYLVFPWLAWLLTRRPSLRVTIAVGVGIVAAGMLIRGYASLHDMDFIKSVYFPTWSRLDGLLAGVVLATLQIYHPSGWKAWQAKANLVALAGLVVTGAACHCCRQPARLARTLVRARCRLDRRDLLQPLPQPQAGHAPGRNPAGCAPRHPRPGGFCRLCDRHLRHRRPAPLHRGTALPAPALAVDTPPTCQRRLARG
jgi:peptidoglycan/LPS O-acetylase OafA/YrhL